MDELTITKPQLRAVLLRWEQDARAGKNRPRPEADALPVEQVADEGTEHVWRELMAADHLKAFTLPAGQPLNLSEPT